MSDNWEIYQEILESKKTCPIPILPVFSSITTCAGMLSKVRKSGTIFFHDEVIAGRAVGNLVNRTRISTPEAQFTYYNKAGIEKALQGQTGALSPASVEMILRSAGFDLPPQIEVSTEINLVPACRKIGYPVVLKVIGPLHKSDVGGVKVNINDQTEAKNAWKELMEISGAQGVLVQKLVQGVEVILGTTRERDFGHVMMFGLGGIYTEVLKDVRFALAPLSKMEAGQMISGIRSYAILEGARSEKGVSVDILADYLTRLSRLVTDFPMIREMDINPVKGTGHKLYAVDARILAD